MLRRNELSCRRLFDRASHGLARASGGKASMKCDHGGSPCSAGMNCRAFSLRGSGLLSRGAAVQGMNYRRPAALGDGAHIGYRLPFPRFATRLGNFFCLQKLVRWGLVPGWLVGGRGGGLNFFFAFSFPGAFPWCVVPGAVSRFLPRLLEI